MAQWVKIWLETQVQSDTGDSGSVPGSGRSGGGNGNPLHYSHLGNSRDRGAWRPTVHEVTKSQTWLSTRHTLYEYNIKNCGCSVAKSCPTLCDPMDCSTPGFPVLHYLQQFAQTHVHRVNDDIQPSPPCHLLLPSVFPSIRVFSKELVFHIRWPEYWKD